MSEQKASLIVVGILFATIAVIAIGTELLKRRRNGATSADTGELAALAEPAAPQNV
jgi:hypothetical protein